ncbi:MAG: PEP-CTERM sorting domain-containing protein, partial [bacterium]|nr:PEP-CTERM sorting domain-containing protein [bacterium]
DDLFGNAGTGVVVGALNAVTSHSNGGNAVTNFNGDVGGVGGGLDFGLVAAGSTPFGNSSFILDSIIIDLALDQSLLNLDFLNQGSYVEFGSDYLYVPPVIPEPATLSLVALGLGIAGFARRRMATA